jgi:predicted O-linked N-acetylglucosamine transferase (SPINDLY family)
MFAAHGIVSDWLTLLPGTDRFNHFLAYHGIDIALDPFPHGGGIATLDALWMGVPVVTTPGPTLSSRRAAACLTTVGATEFIAQDYDAYVSVAAERARDLDALARLRGSLRQRMFDSGISDLPRYASGVEQAYRTMWRSWCERQTGRS